MDGTNNINIKRAWRHFVKSQLQPYFTEAIGTSDPEAIRKSNLTSSNIALSAGYLMKPIEIKYSFSKSQAEEALLTPLQLKRKKKKPSSFAFYESQQFGTGVQVEHAMKMPTDENESKLIKRPVDMLLYGFCSDLRRASALGKLGGGSAVV